MTKEKIEQIIAYLADRLREPSTHNALAIAMGYIGLSAGDSVVGSFCYILSGVFTLAGILIKEKGN